MRAWSHTGNEGCFLLWGYLMLTVHMIGNAHLDPVWLWGWQQGADEALATFRSLLTAAMNIQSFSIRAERPGSTGLSSGWTPRSLRGFASWWSKGNGTLLVGR